MSTKPMESHQDVIDEGEEHVEQSAASFSAPLLAWLLDHGPGAYAFEECWKSMSGNTFVQIDDQRVPLRTAHELVSDIKLLEACGFVEWDPRESTIALPEDIEQRLDRAIQ